MKRIGLGKKIMCVETKEIFQSQKAAAQAYGLDQGNISRACRGLLQTCGGYHWKFVELEIEGELNDETRT